MNYLSSTIVSSLLFLMTGCSSQNTNNTMSEHNQLQKKETLNKIELTERTRGTNRIITFKQNQLTVNLNGTTTVSAIKAQEWESISELAMSINLEKIFTYEAPTTGRFSDAALASTIIITTNGKSYSSAGFDSGKPPAELNLLYKKLKESSNALTQK